MTPPCRLGENAPTWLVLTAPSFRPPNLTESRYEPDPAKVAEHEAENQRRHLEAVARREAVAEAKRTAHAIRSRIPWSAVAGLVEKATPND